MSMRPLHTSAPRPIHCQPLVLVNPHSPGRFVQLTGCVTDMHRPSRSRDSSYRVGKTSQQHPLPGIVGGDCSDFLLPALRDLVCSWAERAGMRPEKERTGLLLPLSPEDTQGAGRRPADVYLPALAGSPAALDFAITAPQRQEALAYPGLCQQGNVCSRCKLCKAQGNSPCYCTEL